MGGVGPAGASHLVFFGVFLPYVAIRSAFRIATRPFPPKEKHFTTQTVVLLIFLTVSLVAARFEHVPVFPNRLPSATSAALGGAMLAGLIVFMRPLWRKRVKERSRRVWLFMPRTPRERTLWILCSVAAGISEELTYRGVMFTLLWRMSGNAIVAASITALVFSISHFMQGWKSMAVIFAMALVFQGLVWTSGSLYVAMAVHALYDVAAGLFYGRYGRELDYPIEAMPPGQAPAPA